MRHLKSGRKLGVSASHRKALLRSMTLALIEKERIRTTPPRAKEVRKLAERVVTFAKRGDLNSRRQMVRLLGSTRTAKVGANRVRLAMERVYSDLAPRFKSRNGGYTQIIRLHNRRPGDNAELCLLQYLPRAEKKKAAKKGAAPINKKKAKPKDKTE